MFQGEHSVAAARDRASAAQAISEFAGGAAHARRVDGVPAWNGAHAQLSAFVETLEDLAAQSEGLRNQLQEGMARLARQFLVSRDLPAPSTAEFIAMMDAPIVGSRGGTVVRAFWWGFHIQVSHADLTAALNAANTVNTLVDLIGGSIPSPAAPFIKLAAMFVGGAIGLVRSLDRGRGVYISMSWFAPGIFVPTSV